MREAVTVGFSIRSQRDQERLEHLADVFGNGNRSEFLRRAMDIMERKDLADRLVSIQGFGERAAETHGIPASTIPQLVDDLISSTSPEARSAFRRASSRSSLTRLRNTRTGESSENLERELEVQHAQTPTTLQ